MKTENIIFQTLLILIFAMLFMVGYYGDVSNLNQFGLATLWAGCLSGAFAFLWVLFHCLGNKDIDNKLGWFMFFIFGTFLVSIYYFYTVYRYKDD